MKRIERTIQQTFVALVRQFLPDLMFTALPLGEHRDKRTAAVLKTMGVNPGYPDVFFPSLRAFIEFKAPDGSLSDEQRKVIGRLVEMGYIVAVHDNARKAFEWLKFRLSQ